MTGFEESACMGAILVVIIGGLLLWGLWHLLVAVVTNVEEE